jgi:hypothetical protein
MNRAAEEAGFVVASVATDTEIVFSAPPLEVRVPSVAHMLARKVARLAETRTGEYQRSCRMCCVTPRSDSDRD